MFEKGSKVQPKIAKDLSLLIEKGAFPRSVLFSGEPYTCRLTMALETIEAISGENLYKNTSNIFLYLSRDVSIDFNAKANIYLYSLTQKAFSDVKYAFFIVVLYLLFSSARSKDSSRSSLDKDKEADLLSLFSSLVDENDERCENAINAIKKAKELVAQIKPMPMFSIDDVRLFKESSSFHSSNAKGKFFIIEGLAIVSSAAKNAFLKLLEEPPENTYFFIVETDKALLGETLLSRLVPFNFKSIPLSLKNEIIASFNDDGRLYSTLGDFFLEKGFEGSKEIKGNAKGLASSIFKNVGVSLPSRNDARSCVKRVFSKSGSSKYTLNVFNIFINEFLYEFQRMLSENPFLSERSLKILSLLRDAKIHVCSYNQNPRNVLFALIDNLIEVCYNI